MMSIFLVFSIVLYSGVVCKKGFRSYQDIEKWDQFEYEADGPSETTSGTNPFVDVIFGAFFQLGEIRKEIIGFYDGDGKYKVRFMPQVEGKWTFTTFSNIKTLRDHSGDFNVTEPSPGNRGQAKVFNYHSFRWENGDEYFSVGTTENTIQTLADYSTTFNKIRYCVFPKYYTYTKQEPPFYPYEGKPPTTWHFDRFHIPYWKNFEKQLKAVQDLGYISDLILFHPYDGTHWGFDIMEPKYDALYLRYVMARFSSFRSVWWSMANEWDHPGWNKTLEEWQALFSILENEDPYQHERSIHNQNQWYDYNISAITHNSLQLHSMTAFDDIRTHYVRKPYCVDEMQYEGDIPSSWGHITGREMTERFWLFAVNLAHGQHGETIYHEIEGEPVLWWSKGNVLRGESPKRIEFYRNYFETQLPVSWEELETVLIASKTYALRNADVEKIFYLVYWNFTTSTVKMDLSSIYDEYDLTYIDIYEMTSSHLKTVPSGSYSFTPPSYPYLLDVRAKGKKKTI